MTANNMARRKQAKPRRHPSYDGRNIETPKKQISKARYSDCPWRRHLTNEGWVFTDRLTPYKYEDDVKTAKE